MNFLTIPYIKAHSRIEFDCEDEVLEHYAESAESTILNALCRSSEDLHEEYGGIPKPIIQAGLMLVDLWYQQRSPVSQTDTKPVPYTIDILIKPYIKLA